MIFYIESRKRFYHPVEWGFKAYKETELTNITLEFKIITNDPYKLVMGKGKISEIATRTLIERFTDEMFQEIGGTSPLLNLEGLAVKIQKEISFLEKERH